MRKLFTFLIALGAIPLANLKRFLVALILLSCVSASAQMPMTGAGLGKPAAAATAKSIVTANAAKQYLTTTWSHAPTDPKKATIAYWQKWINLPGAITYEFTTAATGGVIFDHRFDGGNHYQVHDDQAAVYDVFDTGFHSPDTNWHHICIQIDTTQATPVHVWVDGIDSGTAGTQPTLNSDVGVTANGIVSYIGEVFYLIGASNGIPDAKFAYVYLIDGQSLTPSSFTTGTGAGSTHPAAYGGTYGANGFFLNGNGGTSGTVPDQSGNNNNWTAPNNITFSADLPT